MPDDESQALVSAVADNIMAYLKKNDRAGDTASGIHQWWLSGNTAPVDVRTVELALEKLAASRAIGVRVLASGEQFYFGLGGHPGGKG